MKRVQKGVVIFINHHFYFLCAKYSEFTLNSKLIYANLNTNIYQLITYEGELKK